jgi:hypothetical protein
MNTTKNKIRFYPHEEFREITLPDKLKFRYAISNKGRLASFTTEIKSGNILNGGYVDGYKIFRYKINVNGVQKNKHLFFYKLVGEYFLPKPSEDHVHLLHLDRKRDNDDVRNLKWATLEEKREHDNTSPFVIASRKNLIEHNLKSDGKKLTVTKVMLIKKILSKPEQKTRLKMIAKQFGVSEMQIRRIKSGENWSQVKI